MARSSEANDSETPSGDSNYSERILKGSSSVFSGSMVSKVIGFVLNLVLARGLGPTRYGIYSLGYTVLQFVKEISTLGLQNGVVRFGAPAHEKGESARLKGTFISTGVLGFGAGLVIGLSLFLAAPWLATSFFENPSYVSVFRIFACGLPFYVFNYLASRMARALGKMSVDIFLWGILQPGLFLLLAGVLVFADMGFTAVLYGFLASTVLAAGISVYAVVQLFPDLLSGLSPDFDIGPLLRFSLPIVGVSLASIGLTYTDRIMLGIFSTSESIGIYQAAAKWATQLRFVLYAITATFSPLISGLYHDGKKQDLAELYANTVRWIIVLTLPAALAIIIFAPQFMAIYGADFRAGGNVLRILGAAYLVVAGVGSVGQMLQMSDHQDFVLSVNVSMVFLNVLLNWLLIQQLGVIGAAIATGLTQALSNIIEIVALHYFLGIHPFHHSLWKPVGAAAAAGLVGTASFLFLPSPLHWVVGLPLILVIYAAVLYGLGLHPQDQSIANTLWSEIRSYVQR
ncbi:MAG TPA: flippase [Salinibacter sp.]|nr:flippase [Salinibacter sp.]